MTAESALTLFDFAGWGWAHIQKTWCLHAVEFRKRLFKSDAKANTVHKLVSVVCPALHLLFAVTCKVFWNAGLTSNCLFIIFIWSTVFGMNTVVISLPWLLFHYQTRIKNETSLLSLKTVKACCCFVKRTDISVCVKQRAHTNTRTHLGCGRGPVKEELHTQLKRWYTAL